MQKTREHFHLHDDDTGEYSIEIDPREANGETIKLLRKLGFNRISLGVQDFNPTVQKAVNRIQSLDQTNEIISEARSNGFHSVSLDLIYGLPHQTIESFTETLDIILELDPDRLSVFNYAHLPDMFKTQRQINADDIPEPRVKLAILETCIEKLGTAGYQYIGMDHFAKPDDELAIAQRKGSLYRNFQGYSTHAECDLIGFGITSIGMINDCYSQNVKTLEEYDKAINAGSLPVLRGIILDQDDKIRRDVITRLICNYYLDIGKIENKYKIDFHNYFVDAVNQLGHMQQDGLVEINNRYIRVTPRGYLLIRNICMAFDNYLGDSSRRYSKVL